MRRFAALLVFAALLAVAAQDAGAQTFTIVSQESPRSRGGPGPSLPSYAVPNRAGSITVPFALSTPPARPAVLSYDELLDLWHRAGAAYGVPWQVLAAINRIESDFGRNMGPSSAGALGWMQFIPDTWMRWGMDADGDAVADPWDPEDAVFAAARYLAAAGAHDDLSRAIFAYNHAQWYVDDVLELAADFDSGDGGFAAGLGQTAAAFRLDALEEQLSAARRAVAHAQRLIPGTRRELRQLARKKLALERRAGDAMLSNGRFQELEARILRIEKTELRRDAALETHERAVERAVASVGRLQDEIASAALAAPAFAASGLPTSVDGYVFPVAGGPSVVSVAHTHHDYPAADIAAPEGAPLYALADSLVTEAYPDGAGKCGIGLKLRLATGAVYVYCHLAYLEPQITAGAALAAGAPVGLVGSTGNSTGPHLHLAFVPSLRYPQEEAWFQSFAGTAYSWQDAPTPTPKRPVKPRGRVFTVVEQGGDPFAGGVITFTR
jgi:murein DD-endopeptidase MepM/ murein hydrolase activator NlpD